jgi:hypothetical protein
MRWRAMLYLSISIHSNTQQKNKNKNLCKNIIFASCLDCVFCTDKFLRISFILFYFKRLVFFSVFAVNVQYQNTNVCARHFFSAALSLCSYIHFFILLFFSIFKWKFFTMSLYRSFMTQHQQWMNVFK